MSDTPRYYKWVPSVSVDLGTMPFEGDWTINDRIQQSNGTTFTYWFYNQNTNEFGRNVQVKVNGRVRTQFQPGVVIYPMTLSATGEPIPVWFSYYGDGVSTVKLPEGSVVEEYEG